MAQVATPSELRQVEATNQQQANDEERSSPLKSSSKTNGGANGSSSLFVAVGDHGASPEAKNSPPASSYSVSPTTGTRKPKRAHTIEEVFTSVSTVTSAGINPPPTKLLLSPRSAECCLKLGINPETLKVRDLDSFFEPGINPAVQRMRHEAYSQRRYDQMKELRAMWKVINHEMEKRLGKGSGSKEDGSDEFSPALAGPDNSTLLELEQKRMAKIQERQKKEINQMLQYEMKINKLQEEAGRKMEEERMREERREREKQKRAKELAEERRAKELKKKAQEDAEEELRRRTAQQHYEADLQAVEEMKRQEKIQQLEARARDQERAKRAQEHKEQTAKILAEQQMQIKQRLLEIQQAEEVRTTLLEEQKRTRQIKLEEKRRQVEQRLQENQKAAEMIDKKKRDDFQEKQREVEEKRQQLLRDQEQERALLRRQQELLERKRLMVIEEARKEEERKKQELLRKAEILDMNVKRVQDSQMHQLELKREQMKLIQQMKQDNVERKKRMDEYKRLETLRKLQESESRTNEIQRKKQDIIQQRKAQAVKAKLKRDMILEVMDKVKTTKRWNVAAEDLSLVMDDLDNGSPKTGRRPQTANSPSPGRSSPNKTAGDGLPKIRSSSAGESAALRVAQSIMAPPPMPSNQRFKHIKAAVSQEPDPKPFKSPYEEAQILQEGKKKNVKHMAL